MTAIVETTPAASLEVARTRAARIRIGISAYVSTMEDIAAAYAERDWVALGYPSWEAYVDGEYSEARLKVSADQRREAVSQLRLAGMSTRAIGSVLGVDAKTVRNDLASTGENSPVQPTRVLSLDGKERSATQPTRPEPDEASTTDAIDDVPLWDEPEPNRCPECHLLSAHKPTCGRPVAMPWETPAVAESYQLPARQELADRLATRIDEAVARNATPPAKSAPSPERDEQTSREVASKNLARCVWTLAGFAATVDAAALMAKDWQPGQDIYPQPTTAERIRVAADYLYELAERWPQ